MICSFIVTDINFLTVNIPYLCFEINAINEEKIKLNSSLNFSGILSIIFCRVYEPLESRDTLSILLLSLNETHINLYSISLDARSIKA